MINSEDIILFSYPLASGGEISFSYQKRTGMIVGTAPMIARITNSANGEEYQGRWFLIGFKSSHKIKQLFEEDKTSDGLYIIPQEVIINIIEYNFR